MIYLDNAATSRFKPQGVANALLLDISNPANSGRSGHDLALASSLKIEKTRQYLLAMFGASDNFSLAFTKNCTESINLAIFGFLKPDDKVVTTSNEHNAVLRPLFELARLKKINLIVQKPDQNGLLDLVQLDKSLKGARLFVSGFCSNVTGTMLDFESICDLCRKNMVHMLVDGAQSVPLINFDMQAHNLSFLACPGHKGLHGSQGTGFLIFNNNLHLSPLLYGGTGTSSNSVYQPTDTVEGFEAGTQFAGGIHALYHGASWSFDNKESTSENLKSLAEETLDKLIMFETKIYTTNPSAGIVSFNLNKYDSTYTASKLNEHNIAVRGGIHCAPLMHRALGTERQGAVRVSFGAESTKKDMQALISAIGQIEHESI